MKWDWVNETKLITKWILIFNSINQVWGFPQSNLRYINRENKGFLSKVILRFWDPWPFVIKLSFITQNCIWNLICHFLKQIPKTIKWMRLITSLRFSFLTIPTSYSFVLGQITIEKTRITSIKNYQESLVSGNNLPYHSLN